MVLEVEDAPRVLVGYSDSNPCVGGSMVLQSLARFERCDDRRSVCATTRT